MPNELNMKRQLGIIFFSFLLFNAVNAQDILQPKTEEVFTRQDTLRGSITKDRDWWQSQKSALGPGARCNHRNSRLLRSTNIPAPNRNAPVLFHTTRCRCIRGRYGASLVGNSRR